MIEFLRIRQEAVEREKERMKKIKLKQQEQARSKRAINPAGAITSPKDNPYAVKPPPKKNLGFRDVITTPKETQKPTEDNGNKEYSPTALDNEVIPEEEDEEIEKVSEGEQLDKDIQNFLNKSRIEMQRQGKLAKDTKIPKRLNDVNRSGPFSPDKF